MKGGGGGGGGGGGLDEDLFTPEESAVAFIVSLNTQRRALKRL